MGSSMHCVPHIEAPFVPRRPGDLFGRQVGETQYWAETWPVEILSGLQGLNGAIPGCF